MSGITTYGTSAVNFPPHFPTEIFCKLDQHELRSLSQKMAAATKKDLCQTSFDYLCEGNLGIPRSKMPQVEGDTLNRFIQNKIRNGVRVVSQLIPAKELIPVQKEMNKYIVNHFVDNVLNHVGDNPCVLPVLVSANRQNGKTYVIDGTHRSASCAAINGTQVVTALSEDVRRTLRDLKSFPGVFQISLDVE